MKQLVLNSLAVCLLVTTLICCPSAASAKDKIVIGFVPMTLNNEYFITMVNGAKQEAEKLGIQLDVQAADQHASAAAQLTIIENMITSGVDGICIVPSSSEGLVSALERCKDSNVPVINLDTKIHDDVLKEVGLAVPFYGTDNYAGAMEAGMYVRDHFKKGTKTAILTGIEGQQNAADRRNGFFLMPPRTPSTSLPNSPPTGKWTRATPPPRTSSAPTPTCS